MEKARELVWPARFNASKVWEQAVIGPDLFRELYECNWTIADEETYWLGYPKKVRN